MTMQTHHVDHELVQAAAHVARTRCRGDNHTMAAAARAQGGRIVTAVNAYHFTGGPCAELVLIAFLLALALPARPLRDTAYVDDPVVGPPAPPTPANTRRDDHG